jgi:hypothetical protein
VAFPGLSATVARQPITPEGVAMSKRIDRKRSPEARAESIRRRQIRALKAGGQWTN